MNAARAGGGGGGGAGGRVAAALATLDAAAAAAERAAIVGLLAIMTAAVFLDALHRALSARPLLAPAIVAAVMAAITYAGLRGGEQPRRRSRPAALLAAGVAAAAGVGAAEALVRGLPNGLVWSQQMALCFMLWVGLLGASLATRDRAHIAFELAGKLWRGPLRRPADVLARLTSAAFAALLALLAFRYARDSYDEWAASGGAAGLFEAFRVPRFLVYGFLPAPLAVMALRFLAHGASSAHAAPAPAPDPASDPARPAAPEPPR
jgi:TRAP-type C4-dicarboxylate transport system permease small subunit